MSQCACLISCLATHMVASLLTLRMLTKQGQVHVRNMSVDYKIWGWIRKCVKHSVAHLESFWPSYELRRYWCVCRRQAESCNFWFHAFHVICSHYGIHQTLVLSVFHYEIHRTLVLSVFTMGYTALVLSGLVRLWRQIACSLLYSIIKGPSLTRSLCFCLPLIPLSNLVLAAWITWTYILEDSDIVSELPTFTRWVKKSSALAASAVSDGARHCLALHSSLDSPLDQSLNRTRDQWRQKALESLAIYCPHP